MITKWRRAEVRHSGPFSNTGHIGTATALVLFVIKAVSSLGHAAPCRNPPFMTLLKDFHGPLRKILQGGSPSGGGAAPSPRSGRLLSMIATGTFSIRIDEQTHAITEVVPA